MVAVAARLDRGVRDLPRAVPVRVPVGRTARPASAGMSIIAAAAFPVQGEVLATPLLGVAFLVVGAILLHVNPFSPLSKRSAESLHG